MDAAHGALQLILETVYGYIVLALYDDDGVSYDYETDKGAVTTNLHWNDAGLPIGVQLIAAYGREDVTEDEIIASDMPWGVAWYADRKSLWIPMTINDFIGRTHFCL